MGGALVLEQIGSPADKWFEPGRDFLIYNGVDELLRFVNGIRDGEDHTEMASRLQRRMLQEHAGAAFWAKVLHRLGMG